jgi:hypothetical protein
MIPSTLLLVTLLASLIFSTTPQGNKKPRKDEDYKTTSLKDLNSVPVKDIDSAPSKNILVTGDIRPSKVTVKYAGSFRALPQSKLDLINAWANRFAGSPDFYTRPYQKEALFDEAGSEHWLTIKEEFVSLFERDLKKGDSVELNVIRLGSTLIDEKWVQVILVEKISRLSASTTPGHDDR